MIKNTLIETLKKILRVIIFGLNYVLRILSISIAIPFIVFFWLFWLLSYPFKRRRSLEPEIDLLTDSLSPDISIEKLLGPNPLMEIDAVFEGGSVKALAQVGVVKAIEELKIEFDLLGGTSGGAIIAALLAAGKKSKEIWKILTQIGLHSFVDVWYLPKMSCLQKRLYYWIPLLANLMFTRGLVSGDKFLRTMENALKKEDQEVPRFKDKEYINEDHDKNSIFSPRYRLKMVATDISRGTPIVLPDDLPYYWEAWQEAKNSKKSDEQLTPDDARDWWPVAWAVRMSMSIPFFFEPYILHLNIDKESGKPDKEKMGVKGKKVLIVDGGVSSNFPIWLFDRLDKVPSCPTFGFLLDEKKAVKQSGEPIQVPRVTRFLTDLGLSVIGTGIGAMDKRLSKHDEYRTAKLNTLGVKTLEFGMSLDKQMELVRSGFRDTEEFLKDKFDWSYYIDQYRRRDT